MTAHHSEVAKLWDTVEVAEELHRNGRGDDQQDHCKQNQAAQFLAGTKDLPEPGTLIFSTKVLSIKVDIDRKMLGVESANKVPWLALKQYLSTLLHIRNQESDNENQVNTESETGRTFMK